MSGVRGYCGIGIYGSKTPSNVGTLWRSAANLGAAFIFTVAHRYPRQSSDTVRAWRHIPLWHFDSLDDLRLPDDCPLIGVEMGGRTLPGYGHPERACYLLGAEDKGLPWEARERCLSVLTIPSRRCLNVAVAGSIVLYDRVMQRGLGA